MTRRSENHLREFLRINFDTTLPRFDVAAALYRQEGPVKMSELSQMLLVSNGNTTAIVDRLEKEGQVKRTVSKSDRRVFLVELTQTGKDWFKTMATAHEREVGLLFSGLGHQELDQIREIIRLAESKMENQLAGA
ncbi:MarR family winged helix-turn-helix transcriptional regulator [Halovulum sp. GXIMD14793]